MYSNLSITTSLYIMLFLLSIFFWNIFFAYVYAHICVRAYACIKNFWEEEGGNIGIFLIPEKIKEGIGFIFLFKAFFYLISIIYTLLNKKPLELKFKPLELILCLNNIKRFFYICDLIKNNWKVHFYIIV